LACVLLESFEKFLVDPYYEPLSWFMISIFSSHPAFFVFVDEMGSDKQDQKHKYEGKDASFDLEVSTF